MTSLSNAFSQEDVSVWEYTWNMQDHLTSLLQTSSYGSPYRESIERDIDNMNMDEDEYHALLFSLQSNQMDPVSHRGNLYNQKDINRHLRRFM